LIIFFSKNKFSEKYFFQKILFEKIYKIKICKRNFANFFEKENIFRKKFCIKTFLEKKFAK